VVLLHCKGPDGAELPKKSEEVVVDKDLYGTVDAEKSTFTIFKTKVEITLVKVIEEVWPVLDNTDCPECHARERTIMHLSKVVEDLQTERSLLLDQMKERERNCPKGMLHQAAVTNCRAILEKMALTYVTEHEAYQGKEVRPPKVKQEKDLPKKRSAAYARRPSATTTRFQISSPTWPAVRARIACGPTCLPT
jgi:hypothetical protein